MSNSPYQFQIDFIQASISSISSSLDFDGFMPSSLYTATLRSITSLYTSGSIGHDLYISLLDSLTFQLDRYMMIIHLKIKAAL